MWPWWVGDKMLRGSRRPGHRLNPLVYLVRHVFGPANQTRLVWTGTLVSESSLPPQNEVYPFGEGGGGGWWLGEAAWGERLLS